MSFNTFKEFEESLQVARTRRKIPNVNKTVLKKVIQSTEAHNRNQEEQDMWMRHFASKKTRETRTDSSEEGKAPKKSKKRKKRDKFKEERNSTDRRSTRVKNAKNCDRGDGPEIGDNSSAKFPERLADSESDIGPSTNDFLVSKNLKWGHDGFHELYQNEQSLATNSGSQKHGVKTPKKLKKKKKRKKKDSKWVERGENHSSGSSNEEFEKKRRKKER